MGHLQLDEYFQHPEKLDGSTLDDLKQVVRDYPWFQAGWFLYLRNLKNISDSNYENELKRAAIVIGNRKKLHDFLNPVKFQLTENQIYVTETDENFAETDENKNKSGSLIDKFLNTAQNISNRNKLTDNLAVTDESQNKAIDSVTENDDFVTETLANIYFRQKKFDKAIEAFKKLSLKYPEKSVYFAARIKDVELLKNF